MKKRLISIMLISALAVTMVAGCGKKKNKEKETTVSETTEYATNAPTTEAETKETTSEEPTTEKVAEYKPGQVYTDKDIYGDKLDTLQYTYLGKTRSAKEHLEYTKEVCSDLSTKYRDSYVKDLEELGFVGAYADEGKCLGDKTQAELEEMVTEVAKVAEAFAIKYYAVDSNGPVFGYPEWPQLHMVYDMKVTADDNKKVMPMHILALKCGEVYIKSASDKTLSAVAFFEGYGVDCTDTESVQDVGIIRSIQLVFDENDNTWKVFDTYETNEDLDDSVSSMEYNGEARKFHIAKGGTLLVDKKAIIGELHNIRWDKR